MPGRPGTTSNWKRNSKAFASVQDIQTITKKNDADGLRQLEKQLHTAKLKNQASPTGQYKDE